MDETLRRVLECEIAEAHRLITEWEHNTFYLGSPFVHCAKLESFAGATLKAALLAGTVRIHMPSEYHAPRFEIKES